jgi:hypothetical protein
MNKARYIYIDDENGTPEISTLNGFNDRGLIKVERFPLGDFKEFGSLKNEIIKRRKGDLFDGIIIDLRLDGNGDDHTEFNAASMSQELRSVSARGDIKAFPIVLCSTEDKIKQTYNADKTSHDLFDYKISKTNPNPDWVKISHKLNSLVEGYQLLNEGDKSLTRILNLKDLLSLDSRIIEKMECLEANYDYAHFVIKNFFHQTGPLINEKILAARLGVDLALSSPKDWHSLLKKLFERAKYQGIFSSGWDRWWATEIEDVFFENTGATLAFLKAEERVKILNQVLRTKTLRAAEPLKFCVSTEYWTICEAYRVPLDPLEGFKIYQSVDLKSWQDPKYISMLAILNREGFTDRGLRPHPSEQEKIDYTQEQLGL